MRDDELTLLEELVGHANALAEQSAGIAAQVEDESLEIAELIERIGNFMLRGFVETVDVHVSNTGLDEEVNVDAVTRNFVAHERELHRLLHGFTRDADVNRGALGSLQQVGDVAGAHVFGGFAVDGDDYVTRMNAGLVSGRADERENHDDFVVARADGHTYAVVLATLVFAHERVRLGIKEIGVRIERVQHAWDGAVVYGLVGVHRFGIVLLNQGVHVSELFQAVLDFGIAGHGRLLARALGKQNSQKTTGEQKKNY